MAKINKKLLLVRSKLDIPMEFTSQDGLSVTSHDDIWWLAPTGKGRKVDVGWLHSFKDNTMLRDVLLDTLIHYAETKSATTVATQRAALWSAFPNDNSCLDDFNKRWVNLPNSTKKTLKGFMTTAVESLGHNQIEKYRDITYKFRHLAKFNGLHPTKGRLTDFEYDSILQNVRLLCDALPAVPPKEWEFYSIRQSSYNKDSERRFSHFKSVIAYRLLIQIARRPKQVAMLKWSDVLPTGVSFCDDNIHSEPTYTGVRTLHIRCFKIKQAGKGRSFRTFPEKWTIHLSESFSQLLLKYRSVYVEGLSLHLKNLGVEDYAQEALKLIIYCPIFPSVDIFHEDLTDAYLLNTLKDSTSALFHLSEGDIKKYESRHGVGLSERSGTVNGTNNRLRHTWLCNAALAGKSLLEISKITNVSTPAARYYLQLGLKERQFIDENYAANDILRKAFSPVITIKNTDTPVVELSVGAIGLEISPPTCDTCEFKTRMVRPIPCYGCSNFRPLLDADHTAILNQAEAKKNFLMKFHASDVKSGALSRIEKAITYIRLTIAICDEIKRFRNGVDIAQ